ncbi:hypothetical protein Tsubulata_033300 [Turnera subulata]|uniref:DUF3527 domain-containing protein n=1 Tax=Turnera subulata TaxID=218843 RepID=A0A9Q0JSR7_9ROSI|nr:hypothetical protein Tsubulata_033300 [Turnera subulata]
MEDHLNLKEAAKNQSLGIYGKTVTAEARKSLNLPDKFKQEKSNLSYAGLHYEIKQNVEDTLPEPSRNRHKPQRKIIEQEELVRYMSNLPSYLERGKNLQERVLNVGVLDWDDLKKWQCNRKQMPQRSIRHSLSSSNSSSPFFAEGPSLCSSRGQSCSPGDQRTHRLSLQCHLMSSPAESHSGLVRPFKESIGKFQLDRNPQTNYGSEQGRVNKAGPFLQNEPETKPGLFKRNDFDPSNPETRTFDRGLDYKTLQCRQKTDSLTQDGEHMKGASKLKEDKAYVGNQNNTEKKAVVLSRGISHGHHFQGAQVHGSRAVPSERAEGASRNSFSDMPMDSFCPAVSSDIPHSCPLPYGMDSLSEVTVAQRIGPLSGSSLSKLNPARLEVSPSRGTVSEETKHMTAGMSARSKAPSMGPDWKPSKATIEKARSTSPFQRLSMGMGRISKSFISKDSSSKLHLSSTNDSANSCSENAVATSFQGNSRTDTHNAIGRAKSSPLRRLLDPLMKPKAPNCRHSGEPLRRGSIAAYNACKPSDCQFTAFAEPMVVKSDITNCRKISTTDLSNDQKCRPSAFQALLRVAFKNGQPLFTFAVDNESDILAATMKNLSASREDDYSCIYNFFAFQEVKGKNGRWMNQAGKGKGLDYAQNIVAQLKVSGSQFSNSCSLNYVEQSFAREYVLFSLALHHSEQQKLDFHPNHELAAIVLKIAKVIDKTKIRDVNQSDLCNDFPGRRLHSSSVDVHNQLTIGSQSHISTTAILPSGIHSLPNNGGPSSLIQRWRTGGACDCGGWDLGCKLRILANRNPLGKILSSTNTNLFELISQGGVEDQSQPVFSLAPFKDGIYSVDFNSSLSPLQAFSLCIAVLDGKRLCEMEESSNFLEENTSLETALASEIEGIKAPNGIDTELPARYVSYPPHSPVGRV